MIVSPLRVYISSSWSGDLEDERSAAEDLIKSDLLMFPVYPKHAATRDVPSDYFKIMGECDLVVVILGERYSEHVFNEINYAFRNNMPVLCFKKDCERDGELDEEVGLIETNRVITTKFRTVDDLRS